MMETLTVDCKTGRKTRRKLAPEEVAVREAEMDRSAAEEEVLLRNLDARKAAIERLRKTELGCDVLMVLGID